MSANGVFVLVAASRSYRLVLKMVLTLQLALVVFFLGALAHLLMRILQLALCGGGACGCIFYVMVVVYMQW